VRLVSAAVLTLVALSPWQRESAPDRQGQIPTFTGGVDLVTVSVVVNNRNGRPVTGLSRTDFNLLDAGEPREIAGFRSEPAPISLAVLFDISGSMNVISKVAHGRDAVRHLASWLEPGNDQIALFAFDTRLLELQPFTTAPDDVVRRLDSLKPFGSTALYDAIAQTGRRLAAQAGPRRAVVVITDGVDNRSSLSPLDVSAAASAIDVPVYILAIVSPLDHPGTDAAVDRAPDAALASPLDDLARWTGGTLFVASAPAHASVAARQIVSELRQEYVMTFEPSARAGWHPLVVRTRDTDLVVRARSGYVAGPRVSQP
jgi:Ca-activated chloride channel family protein